jgi:hypothetical protein
MPDLTQVHAVAQTTRSQEGRSMGDQPTSISSTAATPQALLRLATGYWISQVIFVVAQLGENP